MGNSNNIFKANREVLDRVKTIDELTRETESIKSEISVKGETIKGFANGILKNMATKKTKSGVLLKNHYGGEQEIVFSNYGFGTQNVKYSSNATSFNEMAWDEFIKVGALLSNQTPQTLLKSLKKEKLAILLKFTKDFARLEIDRTEQEYVINETTINFVSGNMLSSKIEYNSWGYDDDEESPTKRPLNNELMKKAVVEKLAFHQNTISFNDTNNFKVKVKTKSPQLEDALILEQIFDEAKNLLEKEIARLKAENKNYDEVIAEIKQNFKAELMYMELAK